MLFVFLPKKLWAFVLEDILDNRTLELMRGASSGDSGGVALEGDILCDAACCCLGLGRFDGPAEDGGAMGCEFGYAGAG